MMDRCVHPDVHNDPSSCRRGCRRRRRPRGREGVHRTSIRFLFGVGPARADNFLDVYSRAETGYDTPEILPGRVRPGKLARRFILALVIGVLAGAAIMLQVKGWTTLGSEAGGACGTSDQGVSYGACPRGIAPTLITSFLIGLPFVPTAIAMLFRRAGSGGGWSPSALRAGSWPGKRCSAS